MHDKNMTKSNLPKNAKQVYKGQIFEVYEWEQPEFDGNIATYELLTRSDTITVIPVTSDGKIILVEEEQPHIPLTTKTIAGKVDPGETPIDAAKRELLEETGYSCQELIPWYQYQPLHKIAWTVHTFIAKNCQKVSKQNLEGGERIKPILLDFDQFIETVCSDKFPNLTLKVKVLEAKLDSEKMASLKNLFFS